METELHAKVAALEAWREGLVKDAERDAKTVADRAERLENRIRWVVSLIITPTIAAVCGMVVLYFKVDRIDNYGSQFGTNHLVDLNTKDQQLSDAVKDIKYDLREIKKALGLKTSTGPERIDP